MALIIGTNGASSLDYNSSTLVANMGYGGTADSVTVNKGLYSWFCQYTSGGSASQMTPTVSSGGKYIGAYSNATNNGGVTGIIIVDEDNTSIAIQYNSFSAHLYKFEE